MKIYRSIVKHADEFDFFTPQITEEMFFQNLDDAVPVWKEWCDKVQKEWKEWFSELLKRWYSIPYPEMKTENGVWYLCIYEEVTQRRTEVYIEEIELQ